MSFFKELRFVWLFIFFVFLLNKKIGTLFYSESKFKSDAWILPFFDAAKLLTTTTDHFLYIRTMTRDFFSDFDYINESFIYNNIP